MTPRAARPWPLLLALLMGVLVAAWRPAAASPTVAAAMPSATGSGAVAWRPASTAEPPVARLERRDHRPLAAATTPVPARRWSWRRGPSRRGGRDVEVCRSAAPLPGSNSGSATFTDQHGDGLCRWLDGTAGAAVRSAAAPRAPPSLT